MFIRNFPFPFLSMNDAGGDNGGGGEAAADATAAADAAAAAAAASAEPVATAGVTPPWGTAENFDADKAWSLVQNLRDEVKSTKSGFETQLAEATTKAATEATERLTRSLGESLGIIQSEAAADPAKLLEDLQTTHATTTQERDAALKQARSLTVANTVLLRAGALNGNPAALLDSRDLEGKFAELDPTTDDYASQVDALITKAVENDPQRFRITQAAAHKSGGDFTAGNAVGADQLTLEELRSMNAEERLAAHKAGRTRTITG